MRKSNIGDILKKYDPSYEKIVNGNIVTHELELNKHIPPKQYFSLITSATDYMKDIYNEKFIDNINYSKDITIYYFNNDIRKYKIVNPSKKDDNVEIYYIKKNRKYYTRFNNIKLTLSHEEKGSFGELDEKNAYKSIKRDRTTFFFYDYNYRIDLDKDEDQKTKKITYQYEIEFLNYKMENLDFYDKKEVINEAIDFMNKPIYNTFIEPKKQKPVSIKRGYIPFLQNYVILPKKDGETVYLYINSKGINVYNKDTKSYVFIKDIDPFLKKYYDNFFIACENIGYKYYMFDMYNDDITQNSYIKRLQLLSKLEKVLKDPNYVTTKYFYGNKLSYRIVNSIKYLIRNDSKELSFDGLIFQKENAPYLTKSIFKWKPSSLLSIDLYYKQKLFYSYDKNKNLVEFKKIRDWEIKDNDNILGNPGVYEFLFDIQKKQILPYRYRSDKKLPNYITVVNDLWKEIKNPISQQELIKLSNIRINNKKDAIRFICLNFFRKNSIIPEMNKIPGEKTPSYIRTIKMCNLPVFKIKTISIVSFVTIISMYLDNYIKGKYSIKNTSNNVLVEYGSLRDFTGDIKLKYTEIKDCCNDLDLEIYSQVPLNDIIDILKKNKIITTILFKTNYRIMAIIKSNNYKYHLLDIKYNRYPYPIWDPYLGQKESIDILYPPMSPKFTPDPTL